ncbi:MAG: UTP--glucose-1-phosphate uridylyltransferase [Verrucomicrobiae bacterium]|nr:UTP--glucose-1-phosphate uridylyltransferase [Verrucomicrobiae bacterium]
MDHPLLQIIVSQDPKVRDRSLHAWCASANLDQLLRAAAALDAFRRRSSNLYERVRALLFLHALHRFEIPSRLASPSTSPSTSPSADRAPALIPFRGYEHLLQRRFEEAIDTFLAAQTREGPGDGLSSALAAAYHRLAFQTLGDQVRRSVRSIRGNQWMFRVGHPTDQPLRLRPELLVPGPDGTFPVLREETPVRMDLTHSGWSDIFFLGMDFPEGAQVLNVSVDLGVHGRDAAPRPPVTAYLRVIEEPVIRLASVDLLCTADIASLAEIFDFAKDHLGLLKAAVIASGIVPPGIEGSGLSLADLLARVIGPGRGLELVSCVNDIPKGSRLAVSTNLLGCLVAVCMRATHQTRSLTGPLEESERRIVLARALLGEWLGGSGGGWQDSGGVWPGIKRIAGCPSGPGDAEFGVSRGRLLPTHHVFDRSEIPDTARQALRESLVLVHGGIAQNVGPILEMVTEKYLLRSPAEWDARLSTLDLLHEIENALRQGDVRALGAATTRNFFGPLQTIIPWASNAFTESLIARTRAEFGDAFWGFWMLGGMSGGGMGFMFAPHRKPAAQARLQEIMSDLKRELRHALPFAMDPLVFDYAINERGTCAELLGDDEALLPPGYYALTVPRLLRRDLHHLPPIQRAELDRFGAACRSRPELAGMVQTLFDALLPRPAAARSGPQSLDPFLESHGFDRTQHEHIRTDLRDGRIGLAQNRLRPETTIEDVRDDDLTDATRWDASPETAAFRTAGLDALARGELAVVTLAAGAGSRWTQGAGVCKALHPFARLAGRHRTFIEVHLAKSRRRALEAGTPIPHVFTTSYLTHDPIVEFLDRLLPHTPAGPHPHTDRPAPAPPVFLSRGRSVGLRLIPTERDLRFQWEEMPQQLLDEQQQKVRESLRHALIQWARTAGEGADYTDNLPSQCLHPVGHFFEIPNLLRNGVLARLLRLQPALQHLLLHNIDTVGTDADPALFGWHRAHGGCLSFEVIPRRIEDRGGGLARVNGLPRLVEGLAMPREEDEFRLRYYNTMTTWIRVDAFLAILGLSREDVLRAAPEDPSTAPPEDAVEKIAAAIRHLAARLPTYVTLKDVKKRWGHGQEDIFPTAQFEKLWSDLSALPEIDTRYVVVPRNRGQQLKDQAQLDGWLRDGSAAFVESLGDWPPAGPPAEAPTPNAASR